MNPARDEHDGFAATYQLFGLGSGFAPSVRGSASCRWMLLYSSRRARFSGALMVARTKGAPIVDLPNSSTRTRGLEAARRRKYSTVCDQLASLRSSPGVKPRTSD